MIKKIIELSKVFIKDYFENLNIFNKNSKKINIKSSFTWLLIIAVLAVSYCSLSILKMLEGSGYEILFLKIYFPILATIFIFQAIMICTNVFFFSKDLEYILPLPIKPIELLIAKFINVISITYAMEALFLLIPLIMYGIFTATSLIYYLNMILVLIIFPIFLISVICIIMLFIMQLTRFIKNKDIFQVIIVTILTIILTILEVYLFNNIFENNIINIKTTESGQNMEINLDNLDNKINELNNYFIIINPCINLLTNLKINNFIIQLIKLLLINLILFIIFLFFGKILYLKNLLKNIAYINKKKNYKKIIKNKYKKNNIKKSYIKNEFIKIIKNPTFFLQCIFQYIFIIIILLFLINLFFPIIIDEFQKEDYINSLGIDDFALQCMCVILGIIQIIYTFGNISLTAISREGKNASVIKYIPVSLYKQFIWKNIPQALLNSCAIIGLVVVVALNVPEIHIWYYIIGIFIAMLLNFINCILMMIIGSMKPNLDWITETSVLKDNRNKLFQYVITILIILLLIYFTKILYVINIKKSLLIIALIFLIILILLIIYVKQNINKIFKNIY